MEEKIHGKNCVGQKRRGLDSCLNEDISLHAEEYALLACMKNIDALKVVSNRSKDSWPKKKNVSCQYDILPLKTYGKNTVVIIDVYVIVHLHHS